jgi:hypothetical protein
MKEIKDQFAKERLLLQAVAKENERHEKFVERILEERGFSRMTLPKVGKDYFTEEDERKIISELFEKIEIPEVEVDYDALYSYIVKSVAESFKNVRLPQDGKDGKDGKDGRDGKDGKDAVFNMQELVQRIAKQMPKPAPQKPVDLKDVKEYIDKNIREINERPAKVVPGHTSFAMMTDVILDGVPQDKKGNYLLNQLGNSLKETFETIDANLTAEAATISYIGDNISTVRYDNGITKTYTYANGNLVCISLSGALPANLTNTAKNFFYSGGKITRITYSNSCETDVAILTQDDSELLAQNGEVLVYN